MFTKETEDFTSWYHDLNFYMRRNVFCLYFTPTKLQRKFAKIKLKTGLWGMVSLTYAVELYRGLIASICTHMYLHTINLSRRVSVYLNVKCI